MERDDELQQPHSKASHFDEQDIEYDILAINSLRLRIDIFNGRLEALEGRIMSLVLIALLSVLLATTAEVFFILGVAIAVVGSALSVHAARAHRSLRLERQTVLYRIENLKSNVRPVVTRWAQEHDLVDMSEPAKKKLEARFARYGAFLD